VSNHDRRVEGATIDDVVTEGLAPFFFRDDGEIVPTERKKSGGLGVGHTHDIEVDFRKIGQKIRKRRHASRIL
jgi:hypothetical protein